MTEQDTRHEVRPGILEIVVGLVAYGLLLVPGILWLRSTPPDTALAGNVGFVVSGLTALGAAVVAMLVRIRRPGAFGFRGAHPKWLLLGAGFGVLAYVANVLLSGVYGVVFGGTNPQGGYHAAAAGGVLAVVVSLLCGAVLTPLGEEALFRGVVANALNRYGWWAGVLLSAAIFALVHGINLILPVAFLVGVLTAILFRRTGSLWPGVMVHAVNNGISTLVFAVVAAQG